MTTTKKIGSIIAASALVMLSTVPCFAANDDAVKEEVLSHSFKAYQVFKGTSVDDEYLTDIDWGYSFRSLTQKNNFLAGLQDNDVFEVNGKNIFENCDDAEDTAKVLDEYEDNSFIVKEFANYVTSSGFVTRTYATVENGDVIEEAGYYVFVDTAEDGIVNPTFIKMVANGVVEIEVKASVPELEKKVQENSYDGNYVSETLGAGAGDDFVGIEYGEGYNDVADYSIGDTVPFKLFGTMASTMDDYDTYFYAFHDSLSEGLTYDGNATVTLYNLVDGEYTVVRDVTSYFEIDDDDSSDITLACENVLDIPNLTATSILVVDYTATLNEDAVVGYDGNLNVAYLEYSNNPYDDSTGTTKEDKVIVFTYAIDVTKTDAEDEDKLLADAEFFLMNANGEYYANHTWVANKKDAEPLVTDEDGNFVVRGLDEGKYTLIEERAPKGYKVLESEIIIEIIAKILPDEDEEAAQNWTTTAQDAMVSFEVTVDDNDQNVATLIEDGTPLTATLKVMNTSVFDLPGTGGMGTTLIYVAGAAFVALAVALIVVKRRANA